jgi:hypothetical protein
MPDFFTFLDRLQREAPVITGAPFSFAIAVLIVGVIIHLFTRWHYKALLTQKDEQLKTKDERIEGKEQVIREYQERQHLLPPATSTYLRLTNAQLRQEALTVIQKFHRFLSTASETDTASIIPYLPIMTDGSPEEWRKAQASHIKAYTAFSTWLHSEYDKQFHTDLVLLRDEISSRIADPEAGIKPDMIPFLYDRPTNLLDLRALIDHFERLARQLY